MSERELAASMPEIGHPERYYAQLAIVAESSHDIHARAAAKVGQYITLAIQPRLIWEERLKYFHHALRRHCAPPSMASQEVWIFYQRLANLVRRHAGEEALKVIVVEDDLYAKRKATGQTFLRIRADAASFFYRFIPTERCPEWFNAEDYAQMKLFRDQWLEPNGAGG